ncbi:MAG: AAA family ATPase, partial [Flavobacteriales bacterium]|nr:AAA family ATPase [Flavobacteriales bacterium]
MAEPKASIFDPEDLRPIFKFIGKNWVLLMLLPALAYFIANFYTHRLADIYAAQAEILLKSQETYDYQSQIYSNLGYYSLLADVTNQQRVISSYDIVSKSMKKLNFNISYYLVGRIRTSQVDKIDALDVDANVDRFAPYLRNLPINIKVLDLDHYSFSYEINGKTIQKEYAFGEAVEEIDYALKIEKTSLVNEGTIEKIKEQDFQIRVHTNDYLVNKYKSNFFIKNVEYTSILNLQVQDELPERARRFLDTLSNVYITYTQETRISVNENTQRYIDKQLNELTYILDSLEYMLEDFKDKNRILDLNKEQQEYFRSMVELDSDKRKLELRLESMRAMEAFLAKGLEEAALPPSFYMFEEDLILQEQVNQLFNQKVERSQKLLNYKDGHVEITRLDSLINTVKLGIYKYTRDTKDAVLSKMRDTDAQINKLEYKLQQIPKSQRDILGIDRKLKVNESLYIFLLEKKASTVIARAAILPEASLVEESRSLGVVGPNKERTKYFAIGGGLIFAVLIGLVRLIFFERIENTRELKSITSMPVIGGIPNYNEINTDPIVILSSPRSNVAEAFRSIRTNLQYLLQDDGPKVILVTSLHPGEGKTFTSSNLAAVLAKAGKKVILLDFDMHKPKVHKTFQLENVSGVSTYLINKTDLASCTIQSQVENLEIITAGPVPPNASELV